MTDKRGISKFDSMSGVCSALKARHCRIGSFRKKLIYIFTFSFISPLKTNNHVNKPFSHRPMGGTFSIFYFFHYENKNTNLFSWTVIGSLSGNDHIMWVVFSHAELGDFHKFRFLLKSFYIFRSAVSHAGSQSADQL